MKKQNLKIMSSFLIIMATYLIILSFAYVKKVQIEENLQGNRYASDKLFAPEKSRVLDTERKVRCVPGEIIVKFKNEIIIGDNQQNLKNAIKDQNNSLKVLFNKYSIKEAEKVFKDVPAESKNVSIGASKISESARLKIDALRDGFSRTIILKIERERVNLDEDMELLAAEEFSMNHCVEYAEPVFIGELNDEFPDILPNDRFVDDNGDNRWDTGVFLPRLANCWGLQFTETDLSWREFRNALGDDVIVAVIDSGVDYNHPDLARNILRELSDEFARSMFYPDSMDTYGHGTCVAGIIAAVENNREGIIGVAPHAEIMALKGGFSSIDSYSLPRALIYAVDNGAKIINISSRITYKTQLVEDALEYTILNNRIVVFSAGNDNEDIRNYYTSSHKNIICVGALYYNGSQKTPLSNFGKIDILAPGICLLTTISGEHAESYETTIVEDSYVSFGGTSAAAPFVSGTCALLCSLKPEMDFSVEQIRQIFQRTSVPIYGHGFDDLSGYGTLNVFRAMQFAYDRDEIPSLEMEIICNNVSNRDWIDKKEVRGNCQINIYISDYQPSLAADPEPVRVIIEYGEGPAPDSGAWTTVLDTQFTYDNLEITDRGFLISYDLSENIPDGIYSIRARLEDKFTRGEYYEVRKRIDLNNVKITNIFDREVYRNDILNINGIVMYDDYLNCQLVVYNEEGTEALLPPEPVALGEDHFFSQTIDLSLLPEGIYTIRLVAEYDSHTEIEEVTVVTKSNIMAGWPERIFLPAEYDPRYQITAVDGDYCGNKEIILQFRYSGIENYNGLVIYNANGEIFPKSFEDNSTEHLLNLPFIDVDSDGRSEIIYYTGNIDGRIEYIDDLSELRNFCSDTRLRSYTYTLPIIATDINNDAEEEVLFLNCTGYADSTLLYDLATFDKRGRILDIFPIDLSGFLRSTRDFYVYDKGSGEKKLLIVTGDSGTCVGELLISAIDINDRITDTSFSPINISYDARLNYHDIKFGDINGDGRNEIILKTSLGTSVYNETGGVPLFETTASNMEIEKHFINNGWCLADIEGNDGFPEIVYVNYDDTTNNLFLEIVRYADEDWNVNPFYGIDIPCDIRHFVICTAMAIGNCDEDNGNEIIISIYADEYWTGKQASYILMADKTIDGYSFQNLVSLEHEQIYALTMTDINNDNSNEIIYITERVNKGENYYDLIEDYDPLERHFKRHFKLYILNTNSNSPNVEWGLLRYDNNATSTYPPNRPPELALIGDREINENEPLEFTMNAVDIDGDTLTYAVDNRPSNANFNTETGTFTWTPSYDQAGSYDVTFTANDGELTDSETITITVNNVNRPPVFVPIGNKEVNENELLEFRVNASDPDGGVELIYGIIGWPWNAIFDEDTNTFRWTPSYDEAGTYDVTFTASDGELTGSETITITVRDVPRPPELELIGNRVINENELLQFRVNASDPEGRRLSYTASSLPSRATFSRSTHLFRWTPTYTQAGNYSVTFTVSNGILTDSETITITVNNVNRPPVLGNIGSKVVGVGRRLQFKVNAADPDRDPLVYSAAGLPAGATFNASTRNFSWTPTSSQAGRIYVVTFTVSDNGTPPLQDSENVSISVIRIRI